MIQIKVEAGNDDRYRFGLYDCVDPLRENCVMYCTIPQGCETPSEAAQEAAHIVRLIRNLDGDIPIMTPNGRWYP